MSKYFWYNDKDSIQWVIKNTIRDCGVVLSEPFIVCADEKLFYSFQEFSGEKNLKVVSISSVYKVIETGVVSKMKVSLYVNHNWPICTLCWSSKSGRIYATNDEDIDCTDIRFWFEGLDKVEVLNMLFPKFENPLKLKNLTFELEVKDLKRDGTLYLTLKPEELPEWKSITQKIEAFIGKYNRKVEQSDDDELGVVHYISFKLVDNTIECYVDYGTSGLDFNKKLLRFLSKMEAFEKVVMY